MNISEPSSKIAKNSIQKFGIPCTILFSILLFGISGCEKKSPTLFELVSEKKSGITFKNVITESDSLNILTYEYIYNGGGVAIADFDNDGLEDIYFTGNMVNNALYRNKGEMKFEDITSSAGVSAEGLWCSGVNIVDINLDGKKDIYVTVTKNPDSEKRKNLLYINETVGDKISFSEKASEYGVADTSFSMNSIFFDYDNDGDLDLLVINNKLLERNDVSTYKRELHAKESGRVDKLFRNDFDNKKGHAFFTDVSEQAGIVYEGFSLGVNICDINNDGWKDIYITNDFISNDLLYINNQDGTFSNKLSEYIKHTSFSAMGNDISDINNDGKPDIIALDMLPESNYRKKTMVAPNNYTNYINNLTFGYTHQHVRNTLQINMGVDPYKKHPVFSEIAMLSGIEATDWSWAPLIADFDLDGYRDIIITNGFPKDITDRDFMEYKANDGFYVENSTLLTAIPEVKLTNYAYRNKGNLQFENVTGNWGIRLPSFSNGGAYADLDNDGDLDYIVNNINDFAHLYENKVDKNNKNYIKLEIKGDKSNPDGIGTIINYESKNIKSSYEHSPSRGYLSTVTSKVLIGLGSDSTVNLKILWPDGTASEIKNAKANQTLIVNKNELQQTEMKLNTDHNEGQTIFRKLSDITSDSTKEIDFNDYNIDPLLIKKLSNKGQGIAVADVNKDGDDDFYIAGSRGYAGKIFLSVNGKYRPDVIQKNVEKEENAPVFIDIDNDGDLDLYIGCGSIEYPENDDALQDVLLINNNGNFTDQSSYLPQSNTITSSVKICDYDEDGDHDLFIGAGHKLNQYPKSEDSYILNNESISGNVKLTRELNPFKGLNMLVSDALWTDVDGDDDFDLMVTGELMGIYIFENKNGIFTFLKDHNLLKQTGFWNSINGADLDGDGDTDYILGNIGLNNIIRTNEKRPLRIYSKDFDGNNSYDFIPTTYFLDSKSKLSETTLHVKGDLTKELNYFRKRYLYHKDLGNAPIDSIINKEMRNNASITEIINCNSIILKNNGNKNFEIINLPLKVQFSPVYGIYPEDFDGDGKIDLLYQGNNYGIELGMGRMDAGYGGLLKNNGDFKFTLVDFDQSGFVADGEFRSISKIYTKNKFSLISTQINGPISFFSLKNPEKIYIVPNTVKKLKYYDKNNKLIFMSENYQTSGYLSQYSQKKVWPVKAVKIEMTDLKNKKIVKNQNEI